MSGTGFDSTTYVRALEESGDAATVLCLHHDESTLDRLTEGLAAADGTATLRRAETVEAAFAVLEEDDVDCLVAPLSHPGSDGVALIERVRESHGALPVVVVAADGSERDAARVVNAGADGYVPWDGRRGTDAFGTLAERIETVVPDYRSRRRLAETTDLLLRLTEYTSDSLWMFTADWSETVVINDAYDEVWGRSQVDLVDDPSDFIAGVHPDDRERVREKMAVLSGGEPADLEFRVATDDDSRRWVSVHAEPVFDDGEVTHVAGFTRDISERRERERTEREANERIETIVDNLPVVVFTLDPSGVFQHSTGRGLATLGLEPGDLEGESVYDAYADQPDIVDAVDRALDGQEVRATQDLGDLVFETWYRPVFDDRGELEVVVGVGRDVTALKDRQDKLAELSRATQQLPHTRTEADAASVVVDIVESVIGCPVNAYWSYDAEMDQLNPLAASQEVLDIEGVDAATALPVIEPGTAEMDRFESGELSAAVEYRDLSNLAASGDELASVMFVPLGDHGLLNVGDRTETDFEDFERNLIEILRQSAIDALDRVEREAQLERHRTELERSNESLQQFAYVASHDLQEPLRMVSSYVSLLEAEYGEHFDEEAEEYMEFAVDGATRMQEMIDALLQYSRVHTRGDEFVEVDTEAVFAETVKSLELLVEDHSATVEVDDLPPVRADRSQLGQIFQNLLKNAVQHGGSEPTVTVAAVREGDRVRFEVTDDGEGIPESQHERIFEIFKGNSDGTGIGLAMCKRIVERHGGEVGVESAPGAGATFHFTMPAVDDGIGDESVQPAATTDGANQ